MKREKGKDRDKGARVAGPSAPLPVSNAAQPTLPRSVALPVRVRGRVKAWLTLGLLVLGGAVPYFVPGLETYQPLALSQIRSTFLDPWKGHPRTRLLAWKEVLPPTPPTVKPAASLWTGPEIPLPRGLIGGSDAPTGPTRFLLPGFAAPPGGVEDFGGAMESFYAALLRTANREGGAVTRIAHLGDSPLTGDLISGEARARLQKLYGDAGHGFLLAGKPWEWYGHLGSFLEASGWRIASPFLVPHAPGPCGVGGAGFSSASPDARTIWGTAKKGVGSAASRFEVHYLGRPGGGTFFASLDGGPPVEISTAAPRREALAHTLRVAEGPHRLTVRPKGDGEVILFGAALEREGPGVVYDALGANGASIHGLSRMEPGTWMQDLALRRPDLVILQYGTNESSYAGTYSGSYRKDYREVLSRVRRAVPGVSILVMAPMDRGERDELGEIVTAPGIPRTVEVQRSVAREEGCAFFDTFEAMGGSGTMARWYEREPPLVSGDLTHPSRTGADIVARALVDALQEAFHTWVAGGTAAPPPDTAPKQAAPAKPTPPAQQAPAPQPAHPTEPVPSTGTAIPGQPEEPEPEFLTGNRLHRRIGPRLRRYAPSASST